MPVAAYFTFINNGDCTVRDDKSVTVAILLANFAENPSLYFLGEHSQIFFSHTHITPLPSTLFHSSIH